MNDQEFSMLEVRGALDLLKSALSHLSYEFSRAYILDKKVGSRETQMAHHSLGGAQRLVFDAARTLEVQLEKMRLGEI